MSEKQQTITIVGIAMKTTFANTSVPLIRGKALISGRAAIKRLGDANTTPRAVISAARAMKLQVSGTGVLARVWQSRSLHAYAATIRTWAFLGLYLHLADTFRLRAQKTLQALLPHS